MNNKSTRVRKLENKNTNDNPPIIITTTTAGTNPGKKKGTK